MTFPSPNQDIGNGASFLTRFIQRNPTILRSDRLTVTNGPLQHYGVEQSILSIIEHQPISLSWGRPQWNICCGEKHESYGEPHKGGGSSCCVISWLKMG